jgi:hypothetical protein
MEKRAVAPLVLGGAGLALAVAVVVLMVKVRAGASSPDVHPADAPRASARTATPAAPPAERSAEQPAAPSLSPPPAGDEPQPGGAEVGIGQLASPSGEDPGALAGKMTEANRLYDRGDYEAAKQVAEEVLKEQPHNVKMLRIGASTACILGDASGARVHYDQLPDRDKQQIARRCRRYGVEF